MSSEYPFETYAPSVKFQRSLGWLDAVTDTLPKDVIGAVPMRGIVEFCTRMVRQALAEADAMAIENERMRGWFTDQLDAMEADRV